VGGKGSGDKKCGVVIDLDDLVKYRHLSFAWFARMAIAWLVGQDPFEEPVPIGEVLDSAVREVEELGLGSDLLGDLRSSEPGNLSVNKHFMKWESKEFMRVFGGRGDRTADYFCAKKYVIGLSMLGRELTRVYGKKYLLMEPHAYLRYLAPTEYREFYNSIQNFVREYERRGGNEGLSETAFMIALAGLVINKLRKYGVDSYKIRKIIEDSGGSLVLYLVSRDGITPLNLTNLVDHILRLEWVFGLGLSRALAGLAGKFVGSRRGDVIDSMNTVGNAVFKYTTTGDLGYIYNMIRTVTTSEDYAWVLKPLLGGVGGEGDKGGD